MATATASKAVALLLTLLLLSSDVNAQYSSRFGSMCRLEEAPIVLLSKDKDSGVFTVVKRLPTGATDLDEGDFRRRELTFQDLEQEWQKRQPSVMDEHRLRQFTELDGSSLDFEDTEQQCQPGLIAADRRMSDDGAQLPSSVETVDSKLDEQGNALYYAKECACLGSDYPVVYCPFVSVTCNRPYGSNDLTLPGCLGKDDDNRRARNGLLYIIGIYPIVTMCIFLTTFGRYSISYVLSWVPGWDRVHVNYIMERNPRQARSLIRNYVVRNQRILERRIERQRRREERLARQMAHVNGAEAAANTAANRNGVDGDEDHDATSSATEQQRDEPVRRPASLALRTGTFQRLKRQESRRRHSLRSTNSVHSAGSEGDNRDDDHNTPTCTICFVPLEDGDRIGLLACQHSFHVECLKQWLKRKNVCPLCQQQDVAVPRYDEDEKKDEASQLSRTADGVASEDDYSSTDVVGNL